MLDIPKAFDREEFLAEAETLVSDWVKRWTHPASGPSLGARRDTNHIGAKPDEPFIAEQRRAYTAMLNFFATNMILTSQTEQAQEALRAIHRALDRVMGGGGGDRLRLETLNDVFLRTLEVQNETAVRTKGVALVDHIRLLADRLEEALNLPGSKEPTK